MFYLDMNIILRNRGFMVRFLLWSLNLSWQMAALCNRHSSCCERLLISAATETPPTSFARSRYSRALLLSLNTQNTALAPDVCRRLCSLDIHDRNRACPSWKRKTRPHRAECRHQSKTVDTIRQKQLLTRYTHKPCSCPPISDDLLPTNLVLRVCSAQLADRVDQLGSHCRRRPARKFPYSGGCCKQGQTIPVIVTDRSQPWILHPFCT